VRLGNIYEIRKLYVLSVYILMREICKMQIKNNYLDLSVKCRRHEY